MIYKDMVVVLMLRSKDSLKRLVPKTTSKLLIYTLVLSIGFIIGLLLTIGINTILGW